MARMGRPPIFDNCMDMAAQIDLYFDHCDSRMVEKDGVKIKIPEPYLVTGLALYLDLTTEGLCEYARKPDFSVIIKKAKQRIAQGLQLLSIDSPQKAAGCLFNLKANHNMNENIKVDLTADIEVKGKMKYVDPRDVEKE